tara:strand:+ start:23253 stop:23942 length:690 start_codon:yes stop_codon:yes gene_type:complete
MKVIILAGGFGTRISEYTKKIPKPMIKIGNTPIIEHIIKIYEYYGYSEFIIAIGYKGTLIKNYFKKKKYNIKFVNSGVDSMTGGRLKKISKYIKENNFLLTYGDGLSNVNIKKLVKFHQKHRREVTITAVKPPARFGALKINGNKVVDFREKFKDDVGWINGGFFVMKKKFLKRISNSKTYLERKPLETASKDNELMAFKHRGFWQCLDTKRDLDLLTKLSKGKKTPWQ